MGLIKLPGFVNKALDIGLGVLSKANPLLGAGLKFAKGLLTGENPLKAALGAVTGMIPGLDKLKGLVGAGLGALGKAKGAMDGMGGNALLNGLLNAATGKKGVTDVIGQFMGNFAKQGLSQIGMGNIVEQAAQRMGSLLQF